MSEITISSLKTLFRFPFQGPDWRNRFIVGSVLSFAGCIIPIVPSIFVAGYLLQVMRRAIQGEELTLPAWEDWSRLGVDGLRALLVSLAYFLPGLIVFIGGLVLYFAASFSLPFFMNAADETSALAPLLLLLATMAIMFLSMFIGSILLLAGAIPWPMATAHFVAQDRVAAAFRVREWWPLLTRNGLGYFIAWVVTLGLAGVLYLGAMLAYYSLIGCFLIPFLAAPLGFYLALVGVALFGATYRESLDIQPTSG